MSWLVGGRLPVGSEIIRIRTVSVEQGSFSTGGGLA